MKEDIKTLLQGMLIGALITLAIFGVILTDETSSYSGSLKVLRESGFVEKGKLYDRSILYYEPQQTALNKQQCKALAQLADEYIIIINTCGDDEPVVIN